MRRFLAPDALGFDDAFVVARHDPPTRLDDEEVGGIPLATDQLAEQAEVAADLLEVPVLLGGLGARLLLEAAVGFEAGLEEGQLAPITQAPARASSTAASLGATPVIVRSR